MLEASTTDVTLLRSAIEMAPCGILIWRDM